MYVYVGDLDVCGERIVGKLVVESIPARVYTPTQSDAQLLLEIVALGDSVNRDLPPQTTPYRVGDWIIGDRYAARPCRLLDSKGTLVQTEFFILTRADVIARVRRTTQTEG